MRKRLIRIEAVLVCLFLFNSLFTNSVFALEKIYDFSSDIAVSANGSLVVQETIVYDFEYNLKHGIYRDIPVAGNTEIEVKEVEDEIGNKYQFQVSKKGGILKIKIGDPQKTISGKHVYKIFYEVKNGVRFFKDHDEVYWNVTGNDWQVSIENAGAKIGLPQKVSENALDFSCFTGTYGSKESDCRWEVDAEGKATFRGLKSFSSGEGLTVVLGWPKGMVRQPAFLPLVIWLKTFWPLLIPLLVFIYLFREWWRKGRDFPLKGPVVAQYEPPDNLGPLEVGLIMRQEIRPKDVPVLIVDLAVRGYLKIRELEKTSFLARNDYELVRLKDFQGAAGKNEDLQLYEKEFLADIFGNEDRVLVSDLKNSFYTKINELVNRVCAKVAFTGNYFTSNPKEEKKKWAGLGTFFAVFGLIAIYVIFRQFFPVSSDYSVLILLVSLVAVGIIFSIFSRIMPKRTEKGAEAYWKILGFKDYINTAEKYRVQFQEKENIFEKYLPYAMVFGLAEKWGRAFEGIYNKPPSWYEGNFGHSFAASAFAVSINNNLSSMGGVMASRPGGSGSGFGGGGSSGGGGGGGGGGSW